MGSFALASSCISSSPLPLLSLRLWPSSSFFSTWVISKTAFPRNPSPSSVSSLGLLFPRQRRLDADPTFSPRHAVAIAGWPGGNDFEVGGVHILGANQQNVPGRIFPAGVTPLQRDNYSGCQDHLLIAA